MIVPMVMIVMMMAVTVVGVADFGAFRPGAARVAVVG
jgi:hypothetical protein